MILRVLFGILLASSALMMAAGPDVAPSPVEEIKQMISDGEFAPAEEAARELVRNLEETPGIDPVDLATALDLLAESLWRGGKSRDPEALEAAERAIVLKEEALGPDAPEVADSLKNLATVLRLRAEPDRIQALLDRAIDIQERALGSESYKLIKTLNALGSHLNGQADYDGAEPIYLRALALSEKAYGMEARQVAVVLNNLASMYQESGAFEKAIPAHERAIEIMEAVHEDRDHPEVAFVMNSFANTLWYLGSYQEAQRLHEQALAIRERLLGPDHRSVAASLNNLSLVLQDLGDLAAARPLLERAVSIWKISTGPEHPLVAQGYNNLGTLSARLGDFAAAQKYLEDALAIREEKFGPDHPAVAQTLLNLGQVFLLTRDYARAKPLVQRTIEIWVKALGEDNAFVAMARGVMGQLLLETGDTEAALPQFQQALAMREKDLGADHPLVAETLSALGDLHRVAGDYEKARDFQARSLVIRETALGPAHPDVAVSRTRLAEVDFDLAHFAAARDGAAAGAASFQQSLRNTIGALSEREALILVGESLQPEVTLFSGLLADEPNRAAWLEACWTWNLEQRGLVLRELAERHRTAQLGDSEEVQSAWNRLIRARRLLAATWVRGPGEQSLESYREKLEQATRAKEDAEIEMAQVSVRFRQEREADRTKLSDLYSALPAGSALVEIVRVPIRLPGSREETVHDIALILQGSGKTGFADLGSSAAVDERVARWRVALDATAGFSADGTEGNAEGYANMLRLGWEIRQAIWEPIKAGIGDARSLFLVPDGSLHQINFAALPDKDGVYLLENGPAIHLLGAARDLRRTRGEPGVETDLAGQGVLLLGAPDFDASPVTRLAGLEPALTENLYRGARTICTPVADVQWPSLPQSAREVNRIASLFQDREQVTVLSGAEASEERLKLEAPGKRVLHLATHGYFLQEECTTVMRESPLLLSGLVLAGANRAAAADSGGADDGVLTAEEVTSLDLRGMDLVVLSACDTGRGTVATGEGVFGLRQSLEMAGVRTVVMSVWPVPDREARRWMVAFYESVLAGTPIGEATRRASLAGLERLRSDGTPAHPYLWGGFVVAGDWR